MQPTDPQTPAAISESEDIPVAPATWKDVVRQHITGPVFSLAFHIILLVLLGTLVIIVPNAVKEDIDPVQITELEPVLPPPEEEPVPSDMTVMDTSSPSLDRYDSSNQQMEEVGVSDVEVMTDIDIPTPLVVPDSNSALKLQGVLPFGRKGGGDMGDGRDGDGRGNTVGMLQGVFYDLKQTRGRQPNDDFRGIPRGGWRSERVQPTLKIMRSFVNGAWRREYDSQGRVHYPDLDRYYSSPTRLWNSCFYTAEGIDADLAPKSFECGNEVDPAAWVCIYSGNVVAPFTGKFRFLGTADDVILVRFNKEIVLDYGWASYSVGTYFNNSFPNGEQDLRLLKDSSPNSTRNKSPLYSKQRLEVYSPRGNDSNPAHSLAKGAVISVKEGEVYPIEVLISEMPGGDFYEALYIEQLDANGQPLDPNPDARPLFRTTLDLPDKQPSLPFPQFLPYGPVFRAVRATASSGGGSGSGGSGGLIGGRTQPRTARVNENDDDLSL